MHYYYELRPGKVVRVLGAGKVLTIRLRVLSQNTIRESGLNFIIWPHFDAMLTFFARKFTYVYVNLRNPATRIIVLAEVSFGNTE